MSKITNSARMGLYSRVAAGALLLAAGIATVPVALAQDASEKPDAGEEEIVVTATRRAESAQKVPLAVTAFSGDTLEKTRIQGMASLSATVPGPTFIPISGASGSQMQMRGQFASDDSPAFDTPVGIFIDDIYYGSVASFYPDFYDIDQIAVLRGPQGTTFGRNTVGGALQIVSRMPSFDGFSGQTSITLRNHDGFESTGYVNVPFSDTVAGRLAYSVKDVGGDIHNVTTGNDVNDKKIWSARGSLLWKPSDNLDVLASMSYTRDRSNGDGPVLIGQGALIASLNNPIDSGNTFVDDDGLTDREMFSGFLKLDSEQDWGTITSITAYRTLDALYREDIDGSPLLIAPNKVDVNEEEQFSQELRFTSPSGQTVEWVAGLYYLHQNVFRSETYTFGGLAPYRINTLAGGVANRVRISGDIETESVAPFGELTWHINDQWALRGGVRYTYDNKKNITDQRNLTFPGASTIFFGAPKTVAVEESWDGWTPRAVLEYQPTEDLFFYASVSRGFKSGGFNYAAATLDQAIAPILPELSTSYEIGAKTSWFDRRLRVNLSVYQANTDDLQVRSLAPPVGGGLPSLRTNNAGKAEVKGLELEVLARPIDGLSLGVNYAYTDAKFAEYEGCAGTAALPIDCTGNTIPFVPRNVLNISAEYTMDFANDASLTLRAEDSWASNYEVHILNELPGGPQFPRGKTARNDRVNLFLTYEAPGGGWEVQAWGRNVLDRRSITFATNYFFYLLTNTEATTGGLTEADRVSVSEGQSFGVTFTYRFE